MLIAFDLEGTLLDGELFPEVGERLGLGGELEAVTRDAMNGDLPFEEALRRRTEIIRGVSMGSVRSVASSLPLNPGAEETVQTLRRMGVTPAIITGGFDLLAKPIAERLQVDYVYANHFTEEKGLVTGLDNPVVTPRAKAEHLKCLAAELGIPLNRSIAVGDGANDIPMLCAAGFGIAFDAPPRVREAARASVDGGDIRGILPIVARHLDDASTSATAYDLQLLARMGR